MTFVPTAELSQPHAIAERRALIRDIAAVVDVADGALTKREITGRVRQREWMVNGLVNEMVGTWLQETTGESPTFYDTPEGWVVEGETERVYHDDRDCQHLRTFEIRPADNDERVLCRRCSDCEPTQQELPGTEVVADD